MNYCTLFGGERHQSPALEKEKGSRSSIHHGGEIMRGDTPLRLGGVRTNRQQMIKSGNWSRSMKRCATKGGISRTKSCSSTRRTGSHTTPESAPEVEQRQGMSAHGASDRSSGPRHCEGLEAGAHHTLRGQVPLLPELPYFGGCTEVGRLRPVPTMRRSQREEVRQDPG